MENNKKTTLYKAELSFKGWLAIKPKSFYLKTAKEPEENTCPVVEEGFVLFSTLHCDSGVKRSFYYWGRLEQLLNCAGVNKIALNIGCADGRFTLKVAPNFRQVIAIDVSTKMLEAAKRFQDEQKNF